MSYRLGYRYVHFDSRQFEKINLPFHIVKSPVLNKTRVQGLCGNKTDHRFTLAGFVTAEYVKDFPERMCHNCVDLWKSIQIVEE